MQTTSHYQTDSGPEKLERIMYCETEVTGVNFLYLLQRFCGGEKKAKDPLRPTQHPKSFLCLSVWISDNDKMALCAGSLISGIYWSV